MKNLICIASAVVFASGGAHAQDKIIFTTDHRPETNTLEDSIGAETEILELSGSGNYIDVRLKNDVRLRFFIVRELPTVECIKSLQTRDQYIKIFPNHRMQEDGWPSVKGVRAIEVFGLAKVEKNITRLQKVVAIYEADRETPKDFKIIDLLIQTAKINTLR